jgi:hypothetical protein
MTRRAGDLARYLLWAGVLASADANRRHFSLPSTWVFHTIGNTATLLLPDLLRALGRRPAPLAAALRELVADNPRYVAYVAPLALGYIVSHPRFNIYRGAWGNLRLAGFGLDSIPHATTAWGLTALVMDTLDVLGRCPPPAIPPEPARWARARPALIAGLALALATLAYETAEWLIHTSELRATGGDASRINMEWSVADTRSDVLANLIGWLIAVATRRLDAPAPPSPRASGNGHRRGAAGARRTPRTCIDRSY